MNLSLTATPTVSDRVKAVIPHSVRFLLTSQAWSGLSRAIYKVVLITSITKNCWDFEQENQGQSFSEHHSPVFESWVYRELEIQRHLQRFPQGGICSPILANIYLNELDKKFREIAERFDKPRSAYQTPEYHAASKELKRLSYWIDHTADEAARQELIDQHRGTEGSYEKSALQTCRQQEVHFWSVMRTIGWQVCAAQKRNVRTWKPKSLNF